MKNYLILRVLALLTGCALSNAAYGANLDAPAAQSKPTVRTELKRGHDIAFNCALQSPMDIFVMSPEWLDMGI